MREKMRLPKLERTFTPSHFLVVSVDIEQAESVSRHTNWRAVSWSMTLCYVSNSEDEHVAQRTDSGSNFDVLWGLIASKASRCEDLTVWLIGSRACIGSLCIWERAAAGELRIDDFILSSPPTIISGKLCSCNIRFVGIESLLGDASHLYSSDAIINHYTGLPWTKLSGGAFVKSDNNCQTFADILASLIQLWRSEQLGPWRDTAAGLAWSAFRTKYYDGSLIIHDNPAALALERACYHGGLCELHRPGIAREPISVYDINSLYGSIMATHLLPFELLTYVDTSFTPVKNFLTADTIGFARVLVRTASQRVPAKVNGKLEYVEGCLWTHLCGAELNAAMDDNSILQVSEFALYQSSPLCSDFATAMYAKRLLCRASGDRIGTILYKMLLNGLAGKWGQMTCPWVRDDITTPQSPFALWVQANHWTGRPTSCRSLAWRTQYQGDPEETDVSCPSVAACITAGGRNKLLHDMGACGYENIYYCDTDSLHVNAVGERGLRLSGRVDANALGSYKEECRDSTAEYRSLKNYTLGTKRVIAGINDWSTLVGNNTYVCREQVDPVAQVLAGQGAAITTVEIDKHLPAASLNSRIDTNGIARPLVIW